MNARKRSLQIREDLQFERRQWRVQRAGWWVMCVLLLLALAGLFGNGPLSNTSAAAGELRVEYQRFVHADAPTTLRLSAASLSGDTARISIDRRYLEAMDFQRIDPHPVKAESAGDAVILHFAVGGARTLHVSIDAMPPSPVIADGSVAPYSSAAVTSRSFHRRRVAHDH